MKYRLISDNTDSAEGLRLAGIGGVVVKERGEALRALRDAADDPDVGIILVTDKLYSLLKDEIAAMRSSSPERLVIGIPDRHGGAGSTADMLAFVRETVGIEL